MFFYRPHFCEPVSRLSAFSIHSSLGIESRASNSQQPTRSQKNLPRQVPFKIVQTREKGRENAASAHPRLRDDKLQPPLQKKSCLQGLSKKTVFHPGDTDKRFQKLILLYNKQSFIVGGTTNNMPCCLTSKECAYTISMLLCTR